MQRLYNDAPVGAPDGEGTCRLHWRQQHDGQEPSRLDVPHVEGTPCSRGTRRHAVFSVTSIGLSLFVRA